MRVDVKISKTVMPVTVTPKYHYPKTDLGDNLFNATRRTHLPCFNDKRWGVEGKLGVDQVMVVHTERAVDLFNAIINGEDLSDYYSIDVISACYRNGQVTKLAMQKLISLIELNKLNAGKLTDAYDYDDNVVVDFLHDVDGLYGFEIDAVYIKQLLTLGYIRSDMVSQVVSALSHFHKIMADDSNVTHAKLEAVKASILGQVNELVEDCVRFYDKLGFVHLSQLNLIFQYVRRGKAPQSCMEPLYPQLDTHNLIPK